MSLLIINWGPLPIVYDKEVQERNNRGCVRGGNYSLTCLLQLCVNRTLKYKSPELLAPAVFPICHIISSAYRTIPSPLISPLYFSPRLPLFPRRYYPSFLHRCPSRPRRVRDSTVIVPGGVPVIHNNFYALRAFDYGHPPFRSGARDIPLYPPLTNHHLPGLHSL